MGNFSQLRKITEVFHGYGIHLAGDRKYHDLYNVFNLNEMFVTGLIFEIENLTHKQIEDECLSQIFTPWQIIEALVFEHHAAGNT